jgi:RNA methyltransferase, TrmH family
MSDEEKSGSGSLYRGPSADKRDKRERTRDREQENKPRAYQGERSSPRNERPQRDYQARTPTTHHDSYELEVSAPRAPRELRLYGVNACLANFAKRPESLRKVYLLEARIPQFKAVLAFCVQHKLGYRVVEEQDLAKLTSSAHHEGVCFDVIPAVEENLSHWLQQQAPALRYGWTVLATHII